MLLNDRKTALEVYNAMNGTDYANPEDLIITTLENAIYLGMNNDDLIVLQKANFTTGEASLFKDFILEKSGAKYIWKPAKFVNVCKNAVLKAKIRATQMQMAADQDNKEEK